VGFELVLCILKLELISVKGKTGLFMSTFMIHIRRRTNCANQASALNAEPYSLTGAGNHDAYLHFLTDTGLPDVWVVEPQVHYFDIKPLKDTKVLLVRGTEGGSVAYGTLLGGH
jgi:hypothetical protein